VEDTTAAAYSSGDAQTTRNVWPDEMDPPETQECAIPVFLREPDSAARDIRLAYLLGIGVDRDQVENMLLDFLNIYIIAVYIFHYRNPILTKSMVKVFW